MVTYGVAVSRYCIVVVVVVIAIVAIDHHSEFNQNSQTLKLDGSCDVSVRRDATTSRTIVLHQIHMGNMVNSTKSHISIGRQRASQKTSLTRCIIIIVSYRIHTLATIIVLLLLRKTSEQKINHHSNICKDIR